MAKPSYHDDTLLARWLSGELSAAEEADLRQRPEFKDYERMLGNIGRMQPPEFDEAAEFSRLSAARSAASSETQHLRTRQKKASSLRKIWYAAAASVALICAALFSLSDNNEEFIAANGGTPQLEELKDGSSVKLNDGSTVTFASSDTLRLATLSGEAYFDVEKSEIPFVVQTELGRVTVVGTSFNVYSRAGEMRVSCTSGKVRVKFNDVAAAYPLTPEESVSINAAGKVSESPNGPEHLDWLEEDRSVFINRPLSEALAELERQYDLQIDRSPTLDLTKTYDINFPNDNMDVAVKAVLKPAGYTDYHQDGNLITPLPK
ncbi:MAG: FecR family protein [Lewinella sp.]